MPLSRKILFLPRWYPTSQNIQNGVFLQKHARAAAINNEGVVLYAEPSKSASHVEKKQQGKLTELIIGYKTSDVSILNFFNYVISLFKGWKLIRHSGFHPELCHVHIVGRQALLAMWLQWRCKIPFIVSEQWSGYATGEYLRQTPFKRWLARYSVKKAATVTAVSNFLKEAMLRCGLKGNYGILPNVAEVLPDAAMRQPVTDKFRYLVVADLR